MATKKRDQLIAQINQTLSSTPYSGGGGFKYLKAQGPALALNYDHMSEDEVLESVVANFQNLKTILLNECELRHEQQDKLNKFQMAASGMRFLMGIEEKE